MVERVKAQCGTSSVNISEKPSTKVKLKVIEAQKNMATSVILSPPPMAPVLIKEEKMKTKKRQVNSTNEK